MTQVKYQIVATSITNIKAGDTVLHNGHLKTVSACNIGHDKFLGVTLFGDSYRCGREMVKKADIYRALPNIAA